MENAIILIILIVIIAFALWGTIKHFKGEGDCCGGPKEKVKKKKIAGKKLYDLVFDVYGMHCTNCKNRIENHVNEIEGVVCKVSLEKKQAVVSCYEEVDREFIRTVIDGLDFKVTGIEKIEK